MGYWVPVDGDVNALSQAAISMSELHGFLNLIPARQILLVADVCYSGLAGTLYKKIAHSLSTILEMLHGTR